MLNIYEFFKTKKTIILGIFLGIILLIFSVLNFSKVEASEAFVCPSTEEVEKEPSEIKKTIKIDIKGAVVNPGVYEINEGLIVNDLINLAGGLTSEADTSNINLSKTLENEMVIVIYTKQELENLNKQTDYSGDALLKDNLSSDVYLNNDNNTSNTNVVNLNTASLEELETIPGIGEAKAKSIIEYRNTCGKFTQIEDIKNIKGIGESVFEKIKTYIKV